MVASGLALTLDDFRTLGVHRDGRRRQKSGRQDKGFLAELEAFFASLEAGAPPPVALESLVATAEVTFAVEESLKRGRPVELPE